MRTLVRIIASQMVRSRVGRWALTIILFLIAAAGFIAYPSVSATQSASDQRDAVRLRQALTALITGIVFAVFGMIMLVFTMRLGLLRRRLKRAEKEWPLSVRR